MSLYFARGAFPFKSLVSEAHFWLAQEPNEEGTTDEANLAGRLTATLN